MDIKKIKSYDFKNMNDLEYVYIYNLIKNHEDISDEIKKDDIKMSLLILFVNNAYLINEQLYSLSFTIDVATNYLDEIISDDLKLDEFADICYEAYNNYGIEELDDEMEV